jgi:segregation and condensation protein B
MRQKRKARAEAERAAAAEPEIEIDAEAAAAAEPEAEIDDNVEDLTPSATGRLESIVESLLFAADKPLTIKDLKRLTKERDVGLIEQAIDAITAHYSDRGIVLHAVADAFQFRTSPGNSAWVTQLVAGRPVRLTRAQLESLAIIAYRQPITRPEIEEIRGVDTGSSLRVLLERSLIRILGKKEEPGRPLLYGTTRDFLEFFNLKDLQELPTLREFHELSEDSMREVERLGMEPEESESESESESVSESESGSESEPEPEPESEPESEPDTDEAASA